MEFTFEFFNLLMKGLYLFSPILLLFSFLILILGQIVGKGENWSRVDSLYWSFITGLTVGYGDFAPHKKSSKALSVIIGLTGLMLTGILVAITVHAATKAFETHVITTMP